MQAQPNEIENNIVQCSFNISDSQQVAQSAYYNQAKGGNIQDIESPEGVIDSGSLNQGDGEP